MSVKEKGVEDKNTAQGAGRSLGHSQFLHRVLITVGIVILFGLAMALVWQTIDILLLVFAGAFFRLIPFASVELVSRFTRLRHGWALLVTLLLIAALLSGFGVVAAPRISDQVDQLRERLPQAVQRIQERALKTVWGKYLLLNGPGPTDLGASAGKIIASVSSAFSKTVEVVVGILVILVVAIYTAANPRPYVEGFLRLLPKMQRARGREILRDVAHALRSWMVGQFCRMAIIGILTGLGLWALGIPLALLIGILTGILDFVPIVGTILSAVPAVLFAFLESPTKALYVVLLYLCIHQAEAHLIMPLIQQRAVALLPVVTIVTLVLLERLFGFMGILLAAPLAVTVLLLVKRVYVDEALGDRGR